MKKLALLAIVLVSVLAAGNAFADKFNVTSNYGVRVIEQGVCERIGSTTLTPDTAGTDMWYDGDVITIELLANATICDDYTYYMLYDGTLGTATVYDYVISATRGDDQFSITVNEDSTANESITFGTVLSPICFNLSATTYNSDDANNQLVKVSYQDDTGVNSYSGDNYVATVKAHAHEIEICAKDNVIDVLGDTTNGDCEWSAYNVSKTGMPSLFLNYGGDAQNQNDECGIATFEEKVCFTIDDPNNVFGGLEYTFAFTTTKAGVGIRSVALFHGNYAGPDLTGVTELEATGYTYYDVTSPTPKTEALDETLLGNENSPDYIPYTEVKRLEIDSADIPAGKVFVVVTLEYDSCTAAAGTLNMGINFNRIPCGDSFASTLDVANIAEYGDLYTMATVLPYLPNVNSNWWSGMALTNMTDSAKTVTIKAIEADGDVYTGTVAIAANNIAAGTFTSAGWVTAATTVAFTTTATDSAFGDERFRIEIPVGLSGSGMNLAGGEIVGTAMFGDGSQAQGYLSIMNIESEYVDSILDIVD